MVAMMPSTAFSVQGATPGPVVVATAVSTVIRGSSARAVLAALVRHFKL